MTNEELIAQGWIESRSKGGHVSWMRFYPRGVMGWVRCSGLEGNPNEWRGFIEIDDESWPCATYHSTAEDAQSWCDRVKEKMFSRLAGTNEEYRWPTLEPRIYPDTDQQLEVKDYGGGLVAEFRVDDAHGQLFYVILRYKGKVLLEIDGPGKKELEGIVGSLTGWALEWAEENPYGK